MDIVLNTTDGKRKKSFSLQEMLTIGRNSENDIVIDRVNVSNFHGQFYRSGWSIFYKDLNSKNGSYVNGEKVVVCRFYIEDELSIDGVIIKIDKSKLTSALRSKLSRFDSIE